MVLWFVFCVSGRVAKVLEMFVFSPVLWVLCGGLFLVYLGLEGIGVLWLLFLFYFVQVLFFFGGGRGGGWFCCVVGLLLVLFLFLFFVVFVFF